MGACFNRGIFVWLAIGRANRFLRRRACPAAAPVHALSSLTDRDPGSHRDAPRLVARGGLSADAHRGRPRRRRLLHRLLARQFGELVAFAPKFVRHRLLISIRRKQPFACRLGRLSLPPAFLPLIHKNSTTTNIVSIRTSSPPWRWNESSVQPGRIMGIWCDLPIKKNRKK